MEWPEIDAGFRAKAPLLLRRWVRSTNRIENQDSARTSVSDEHDVVMLGHQGVEEVGQTGGLHCGDEQRREVAGRVVELRHPCLPGHHAGGCLVHIVVEHKTL